mgnify:CR=1 FL=1
MADDVWVRTLSQDELRPIPGLQGRWRRYVDATEANRGMIFGMGVLQPGEVAGWHEHEEPEVFFVLSGQGEARWRADGQDHRADLRPGVAFFKVGHIPHQMVNTGGEPLTGVFFKVDQW